MKLDRERISLERWKVPSEYEVMMEHDKWCDEIPLLPFPSDWKIQITPPYGGAVIRFRVVKDNARVSIYLDCYGNLGCMNEPYWEVYPINGDCQRVLMNDTDELLKVIKHSVDEQNREDGNDQP